MSDSSAPRLPGGPEAWKKTGVLVQPGQIRRGERLAQKTGGRGIGVELGGRRLHSLRSGSAMR